MRSLTLRLALLSGLWVAIGLGGVAWFVAELATREISTAFDARLTLLLDATIAGVALDHAGQPSLAQPPGGADFDQVFSGAYWQIAGDGVVATSRSLWDQTLPPAQSRHPGVLLRHAPGPRGSTLRVAERDVVPSGSDRVVHVSVALAQDEMEAAIRRLRWTLVAAFSLLGAGLVAVVALQVVAGLRPLRRARTALSQVRSGHRDRLALDAPSEIAPLVDEIDALIAQNHATVERARSHVGNLAHALKTPVAVLRNALDAPEPDLGTARAELGRLEHLVQHHLARARAAALGGSSAPGLAPLPLAEEVAGALRRLSAARDITIAVAGDPAARVTIERQDLLEMLGNLLENACKWARHAVTVQITVQGQSVRIDVGDDGPGLAESHRATALQRGTRLDEAIQGTGLGLAIVADLADLYGGSLELGQSDAGGLQATLVLTRQRGT